ncbi:MAG: thiamine phosphate synthase [Planctomycetaceae bacterium]|jgi:thiamine-phosphate pyrophosphorylase|nr:thiamine phosphate synthase [Planctomycetaceae bacterium]
MRFDLTNASYRVLQRAENLRLQPGISSIDAAKILLALFDEEESRAAHWLGEKELTAGDFRLSLFAEQETSPPSFGNIAAGGIVPDGNAASVQDATGQDAPLSVSPSLSAYSTSRFPHPSIRFYLDDVAVNAGRFTPELESTLETIACRFVRTERRKEAVTTAGGGVRSVANVIGRFTAATEHLLLAAVLDGGKTGQYLRESGFDAADLYHRIEELENRQAKRETADVQPEALSTALQEDGSDMKSADSLSVLRIIDAAANRGREAVRVLEDYARFVLNDADLTRQLKEFRHCFQETLNIFPLQNRLAARDTQADVGTNIETADEYERHTLDDIVSANFGRLQESLRSLEEFAKFLKTPSAKQFEQLRYRSYTLQRISGREMKEEQGVSPVVRTARVVPRTALYAILDCRPDEESFAALAKQLIDGGVNVIQLRDKTADDRTLLSRSAILKNIIGTSGVLFMMNDRADLAVLAQADGVHAGQSELPVAALRQIIGSGMLVGISTHNIGQARQAVADGADYIGAGPVFASATKEFSELAGLDFLREIAAEITLPVFAVGGITLSNVDEVSAAGITGIAVSSALIRSENPLETAAGFTAKLKNG